MDFALWPRSRVKASFLPPARTSEKHDQSKPSSRLGAAGERRGMRSVNRARQRSAASGLGNGLPTCLLSGASGRGGKKHFGAADEEARKPPWSTYHALRIRAVAIYRGLTKVDERA